MEPLTPTKLVILASSAPSRFVSSIPAIFWLQEGWTNQKPFAAYIFKDGAF